VAAAYLEGAHLARIVILLLHALAGALIPKLLWVQRLVDAAVGCLLLLGLKELSGDLAPLLSCLKHRLFLDQIRAADAAQAFGDAFGLRGRRLLFDFRGDNLNWRRRGGMLSCRFGLFLLSDGLMARRRPRAAVRRLIVRDRGIHGRADGIGGAWVERLRRALALE
jgi:hypothetical protein